MTMATSGPTLDAQAIKKALVPPHTCSNVTLASLERLLNGSKENQDSQNLRRTKNAPPTHCITSKAITSRKTAQNAKQRSRKKLEAVEVLEERTTDLTAQEQHALAIEVFNLSLKALSEEIKQKSKPSPVRPSEVTKRRRSSTSSRASISRRVSTSSQALQALSPNKRSQSPTVSAKLGRPSTQCPIASLISSNPEPGQNSCALVECARLAISTLRLRRNTKGSGNGDPDSLDHATCSFVGKLLQLGMYDIVAKELRMLRKRIDELILAAACEGPDPKAVEANHNESAASCQRRPNVVDLLRFEGVSASGSLLCLITLFQNQLMRLIAAEKSLLKLDSILAYLNPSNADSPSGLILQSLATHAQCSEKAAQQLQSLAQAIWSISSSSPKTQSLEDGNRLTRSTTSTFRLQLVSFEVRILWWKVAARKTDFGVELWKPFARCLSTFVRQIRPVSEAELLLAKDAVSKLQASEQAFGVSTDTSSTVHESISRSLACLARAAGHNSEAVGILAQSLNNSSRDGSSGFLRCTRQCELAALVLESSSNLNIEDAVNRIQNASEGLKGDLRASSSDMTNLFLESARLNRMAVIHVLDRTKIPSHPSDHRMKTLKETLVDYLQAFLAFLIRYIGGPPTITNDVLFMKYEEHLKKSRAVILSSIESAIAVATYAITKGFPCWETVEKMLKDSITLADRLDLLSEINQEREIDTSKTKQPTHVSLSNIYWTRYLHDKQVGCDASQLWKSLRKAVYLLQGRPKQERYFGFAALKTERLASIYLDLHRSQEAKSALEESIECYLDFGVLQKIGLRANCEPFNLIWSDCHEQISALRRCFSILMRCTLEKRAGFERDYFFDKSDLPKHERGLLLEMQLRTILEYANAKRHGLSYSLESILRTLLKLYDAKSFPLRRLRVLLHIIRYSSIGNSLVDRSTIVDLATEASRDIRDQIEDSADRGLKLLDTYFEGARVVCTFFHGREMQSAILEKAISLWTTLSLDDPHEFQRQTEGFDEIARYIELVVDYFDMQGQSFSKIRSLNLLNKIYELKGSNDPTNLLIVLSRLGLEFSRLGYSGRAGMILTRAQGCFEKFEVSKIARLKWYFAYAEYLADIGNTGKCVEALEAARVLYESNDNDRSPNSHWSSSRTISLDKSISDASFLYSVLARAQGNPLLAYYYARRCVMLNIRIWDCIERKSKSEDTGDASSLVMDSVVEGVSKLSVVDGSSQTPGSFPQSRQGSSYWSFVPRHYNAFSHLSTVSAQCGLIQEARYYAEQAQKIAEAVNSTTLIALNEALRGSLMTHSDSEPEAAQLLLKQSMSGLGGETSKAAVLCHIQWAEWNQRNGDQSGAHKPLQKAQQMLSMISGPEFLSRHELISEESELVRSMAGLELQDGCSEKLAPSRRKVSSKTKTKSRQDPKTAKSKGNGKSLTSVHEVAPLNRLKSLILRYRADSLMRDGDILGAASVLAEAETISSSKGDRAETLLVNCRRLILETMEQLSSHAFFCVLAESAICLPSVRGSDTGRGRQPSPPSPKVSHPSKQTRHTKPHGRAIRGQSPLQTDYSSLLDQAQNSLQEIHNDNYKFCSTKTVHDASCLQTHTSLLIHATRSDRRLSSRPFSLVHLSDIGKSLAFERERSTIQIERKLSDWKDLLAWPDTSHSLSANMEEMVTIDAATFQDQYIDIIPPTWNVVSISLGHNEDELLLSQLQSRQSPFFIRLPLDRAHLEENENENFNFTNMKEELLTITRLANTTSHDARNRTEKKDKSEWWTERQALDHRLERFVGNVERMWLGGFRGIFSPKDVPPDVLSKFSRSLQLILDRNLPSRQRIGQRSGQRKQARCQLHPKVLELFIKLNETTMSDDDMDDALMELLYFVVDILQFQGERNAYDEVDFDMMIVETMDALQSCRKGSHGHGIGRNGGHTILILDRSLHNFPWESLPCLDGISVSRIPSLSCLRDQILRQHHKPGSESPQDFTVDKCNVSYILNPDGDLKTTQATFSDRFGSMPTWTSIVEQAPSEAEFCDALARQNLLLYFGHGSGVQYVRSRSIKRLDQCAAAFLMGCSSGKLTEEGDFEPHGTPWTYMQAGCPALVATLWDVTDKDIDRFALGTFERWGLLDRRSDLRESKSKSGGKKAKAKESPQESEETNLGLGEAVAKARTDCVLKYLNGAAPVIYGIPLYIR